MCGPVAAATAVLGAAQAATSRKAASTAAKAQAGYNERLAIARNQRYQDLVDYQQELSEWQHDTYAKVAASVQEDVMQQYSAMLERVQQFRDQAIDRIRQYSQQADQNRANARVMSLEAGTTGNSVRLMGQQYERADAEFTSTTYKNLDSQIRQSQRQLASLRARSQSQLNQALPGPMAPIDPVQPVASTAMPSSIPYLIQAGSSAISGYATQMQLNAMTPPTE